MSEDRSGFTVYDGVLRASFGHDADGGYAEVLRGETLERLRVTSAAYLMNNDGKNIDGFQADRQKGR